MSQQSGTSRGVLEMSWLSMNHPAMSYGEELRVDNKHQSNNIPLSKPGVEFSEKKMIPQPPRDGRIHPTMSYGEEAWLRDHVLLHATCSQALSLCLREGGREALHPTLEKEGT